MVDAVCALPGAQQSASLEAIAARQLHALVRQRATMTPLEVLGIVLCVLDHVGNLCFEWLALKRAKKFSDNRYLEEVGDSRSLASGNLLGWQCELFVRELKNDGLGFGRPGAPPASSAC